MDEKPITSYRPSEILKYFGYKHLPRELAEVSKPFADLAWSLDATLAPGSQKDLALTLLLQAKDAAVRSVAV